MKAGIIGFGRLGKLAAKFLAQDFDLYIYDPNADPHEILSLGATPSSLDEVCQCPIVSPMVPISEFEKVIISIKDRLAPKTLVIDVCSVKEIPVEIMLKHLDPSIQILGTHPMFGPDSASDTLFGNKIVLCRVRIEDLSYSNIKYYLNRHGLKIIEVKPEEHDHQIGRSLLLTHLIGRSLIDFGATPLEIDTKGYRRLMKILQTVENDSLQLFEDMNHYNRFAKKTRDKFIQTLTGIAHSLK